jgi:hypothetical protein
MGKKIIAIGILVLCLAQFALAKKEKTIVVSDTLITDAKYHFSMAVSKNWKVNSFNEPSIERVYMEKKNYSVNPEVKTYGGDYTIPTVVVFAQEFSGSMDDFISLLQASLDEHRSDNSIIQKLGLLMDSEMVTSGDAVVDSTIKAKHIILKRNYKRLLAKSAYGGSTDPSQQPEKFINDHEIHELYIFKKDNILFVFQAFCEREFYRQENMDEFEGMASKINFLDRIFRLIRIKSTASGIIRSSEAVFSFISPIYPLISDIPSTKSMF